MDRFLWKSKWNRYAFSGVICKCQIKLKMSSLKFKISESDCSKCGMCAGECPVGIIEMNEYPAIAEDKEAQCVECQHCMAVCPKGALSILDKDPADSIKNTKNLPDPSAMQEMVKMRRATRKYKKENVDKELINDLLETASYAPTAHNANAVQFTVVDNLETMIKFKEMVFNSLKDIKGADSSDPKMGYINQISMLWENMGMDLVFHNAPHIVIASVPQNNLMPKEDGMIALSYFELLANSNGLGTLWAGMIKTVIDEINPEIKKILGIPEDHMIAYSMLFGKPAVKYARSIQSEGVNINPVQLN